MAQATKKIQVTMWLERFTLVDKKSMFRSSEPDQFYLQIINRTEKSQVVVREFIFDTRKARDEHYRTLRTMFGMD